MFLIINIWKLDANVTVDRGWRGLAIVYYYSGKEMIVDNVDQHNDMRKSR